MIPGKPNKTVTEKSTAARTKPYSRENIKPVESWTENKNLEY